MTRRQLLAGGLGAAAAVVAGGGLVEAWSLLTREDLVPGEAPDIQLAPEQWVVTDDRLAFAAIGDNGSGGRQAVAVAGQLAQSYVRKPFGTLSMLGDICYYGPISERFDAVFERPFRPLIDAGVGFEVAVGNHDGDIFFDEGVPDVEATLELLGTPARFYSVTRGPVDFFYLDTGRLGLLGESGSAQLDWLDEALAASTRPWRIVCGHHPVYSSGIHGSTARLLDELQPVLARHDVDLYLSGPRPPLRAHRAHRRRHLRHHRRRLQAHPGPAVGVHRHGHIDLAVHALRHRRRPIGRPFDRRRRVPSTPCMGNISTS